MIDAHAVDPILLTALIGALAIASPILTPVLRAAGAMRIVRRVPYFLLPFLSGVALVLLLAR